MEIVTNIASTIGGEIANYTLVPLGRHIGYLIFYDGNVNNLTEAVKTLNDKKTAVDLLIDDAESNLRIPAPEMKTWQQNVDSINARAMKFLEEEITRNRKCLSGLCPNPKSRHSSSRKASKMKQEIDRLLTESEKYYQNDLPAPQPALSSMFLSEETDDFESRSLTVEKILEALADDSSSMVSICGQGGVGKTTMVEKLVRLVESRKLFDEVAMAVVSQNPDVKKVLGDIASCLGLKFNEENEQERAKKLHERIIGKFEKRVLLRIEYPCADDLNQVLKNRMLEIVVVGNDEHFSRILHTAREASSQIHSLTYRNEDCDQSLRSEHEAKKKGPRANRPGPVVEIQEAIPCSAIQNVEQIHLRHCDSLEVIFECDKETAFSTLEEISLVAMGNLKYIFNKIPQGFIGFQQLKSLKINSCEKLEYVFPVSMVRGLLQLQEITISYCSNIKQIIAEEEANPFTDKIILPRLNSIYVYCLGNLKCFYNGFCHIELPQLQSLFIEMSDGIKCFSNGSVSTPLLQDLDTGSDGIPCSRNLNADIMEMWQSRWAD